MKPIAAVMSDADFEIARSALMRLPGSKVTKALKSAMSSAPEEFKYALADALQKRGESVKGYPSKKLVPTRPTTVLPPAGQ